MSDNEVLDLPHQEFFNSKMEKPLVRSFLGGHLGVFAAPYPGSDGVNGDSLSCLALSGTQGVLLLADGAGGTPGGNQASSIILETVVCQIQKGFRDKRTIREAIMEGIEQANRDLLDKQTGAASTLCLLEIDGSKVRPYHVGDSSIFISGQRGRRILKTISHSPHGYGVEAGLLDEGGIPDREHQLIVSNLVGTREMRIEVGSEVTLRKTDTVLLASDGITDNIPPDDIFNLIRKGKLERCCRTLIEMAEHNMVNQSNAHRPKPDDHSYLLYRPR